MTEIPPGSQIPQAAVAPTGVVDPSAQREQASVMQELQQGVTYAVDPYSQLGRTEDYGQPSVVNGGTLRVVAKLGVPAGVVQAGDKTIQNYDRMIIMSATGEDGRVAYALKSVTQDPQTGKDVFTSAAPIWLGIDQNDAVIGRGANQPAENGTTPWVAADQLWPDRPTYHDQQSFKQLKLNKREDGWLAMTSTGRSGTIGELAPHRETYFDDSTVAETTVPNPKTAETAQMDQAQPAEDVSTVVEEAKEERLAAARTKVEAVHAEPTDAERVAAAKASLESKRDEVNDETSQPGIRDLLGVPEQAAASAQPEEAEMAPHRRNALVELRDTWGLDQDATIEQAIDKLGKTFEALDEVSGVLKSEDNTEGTLGMRLKDLKRRFVDSLGSGLVHFNRERIESFGMPIDRLKTALDKVREGGALGPVTAANAYKSADDRLTMLKYALGDVIAPRQGIFMNDEAVDQASNAIANYHHDLIDDLEQSLAVHKMQTEQFQIELMGYAAYLETVKEVKPQEPFAHQRVKEMAEALRKGELSESALESAAITLERYLNDAIDGSGLEFPDDIVKDKDGVYRGGGKAGEKAKARKITAVMAVDMLRGAFDPTMVNHDISIRKDGSVVAGQHRAAALMTIYGKNWQKIATDWGMKVETLS